MKTLSQLADTLATIEERVEKLPNAPLMLLEEIQAVHIRLESVLIDQAGPDAYLFGDIEPAGVTDVETLGKLALQLENIKADVYALAA